MAGVLSKSRYLEQALSPSLRSLLNRGQDVTKLQQLLRASGRRSYFGLGNELPGEPHAQAKYLRDLNRRGDPEAVIRAYESGNVAASEAALSEYVKALARVDRLDGSQLLRTLQRGAEAARGAVAHAAAPPSYAPPSFAAAGLDSSMQRTLPLSGAVATAVTDLGTAKNPLYMMQAEPSFRAQMWKTVRWLAGTFLVMSALGALFEDRGLARGILNNPDMRPQIETKTRFADVKGVDEAKSELEEIVAYLKDPAKFTVLGGKLPKGVLLVGPPGTGKTMLARAIAGEAGVPFFYCSGSEFEEMFVGVGARRVRDLFAAAKKASPCIVFIDEIDAIGGSRNPKDQQYMKMTLNQMLVELDGFKPSEGVIVIAATNFPESLDKALVRPGRFDRHVVVPNPDVRGRVQILESHFKDIPRSPDVDLMVTARGTPGFSGADLANLVNVAALKAARDGAGAVSMEALEYAKDRIVMGAERKSAVVSDKNRKLTAYHEGGHALVALLTEGADPVHKATIVPRGVALGMVSQLPEEDQLNKTKRQMLADLAVCMGGKVAEELIFGEGEVTTGASSDLEQATRIARAMVTRFGMSDAVGQMAVDVNSAVSGETRALVEGETKKLLQAAYVNAKSLLKAHEAELHVLASELLEKETLTGKQIQELIKRAAKGGMQPTAASAAASR